MVDKITSPIGANELIVKVNNVIDAIPTDNSQLENGAGYITGISSGDVTDALGFTPYDASNPDGFISSISSTDVTDALGFTPYDASNPQSFISSAAISSLTDVSLSGLANGEALIYDSTSGKWKNTTIQTSSSATWGSITGTLTLQTDLMTALGEKQDTITGAASSIASNNLTGSRALVSGTDGKVTVSTITTTKLGYLTDVTSNIQAQIDTVSSAIPTSTTQLTNDSGYITGITSSMVTTALGYTPYNSSNPSGYQANVIETIKVNGTAQTPSSKTVSLTIPSEVTESTVSGWGFTKNEGTVTKVNNVSPVNGNVTIAIPTSTTQLTNDSGFITGITSSMITDALTYTPYNGTTNPNGYITSADLSGYEQTTNKTTVIASTSTDTEYPSAKAVYKATNANATAIAANTSAIAGNTSAIAAVTTLIPAAATSSNQLADKNFVNSSISTNTAYFIGTFNSVAELEAYSGTLTNNDYAFVATTDTAGNTLYDRYKYNSSTQDWAFEYELNNSSFTSSQWGAINSGITATSKVTRSGTVAVGSSTQPVYVGTDGTVTTCAALNTAAYVANNTLVHLAGAETITGNKTFSGTVSLGASASATTPTSSDNSTKLATTAFVKAQGYKTTVTSTDVTSALGYTPYNSSNPSGYISGITSSMVTSALGYTPYNSSNPSGYITSSSLPTVMVGATTSAAGATGLVPQPAAGDNAKFLRGDGTWAEAGSSYAMVVTDYTT